MRPPTQKGWARSTSLVWVLRTSLGRDMIAIDVGSPMVQRGVYSVGHRRRHRRQTGPLASRSSSGLQSARLATPVRLPAASLRVPARSATARRNDVQ